jgi:hypothetical protein
MQRIIYAGVRFRVADDVAQAVILFHQMLARNDRADHVEFDAFDEQGNVVVVTLFLSGTIPLAVVDQGDTGEDPGDTALTLMTIEQSMSEILEREERQRELARVACAEGAQTP